MLGEQTQLSDLRPSRRHRVFDLAEQAGFDVSDWIASSNDQRGYRANPKYCYNWSFVQPGTVAILNLWHGAFEQRRDSTILHRGNFRADARQNLLSAEAAEAANDRGAANGKRLWARRATALDQALQSALRDNLAVRVIINDGVRRNNQDPDSSASQVVSRQLDPVPWTITEYNWDTGEHVITRGILQRRFVDQFALDQAEKSNPQRQERSRFDYVRDPRIRELVLVRANGLCEHCGQPGFPMENGSIYLETHHVVPLCEGGPDNVSNVVAICPNDHRRAHYGQDAGKMRIELIKISSGHRRR